MPLGTIASAGTSPPLVMDVVMLFRSIARHKASRTRTSLNGFLVTLTLKKYGRRAGKVFASPEATRLGNSEGGTVEEASSWPLWNIESAVELSVTMRKV